MHSNESHFQKRVSDCFAKCYVEQKKLIGFRFLGSQHSRTAILQIEFVAKVVLH